MAVVNFYFHDDLNYFLSPDRRQTEFVHTFAGRVSIKDMIESLGVPHPEVLALTANGRPVDLTYLVEDAVRLEVWGFSSAVPAEWQLVRPPLAGDPRFVLDVHLGQLAVYLRMLGFDTLYRNDYADRELAEISHDEQRILLSRDLGLLKRSLVVYGYFVRQVIPSQQVLEVLRRFGLIRKIQPLHRCLRCNGLLHPVAKAAVDDRLEPLTRQYFNEFRQCQDCGQVYWKGSHYARIQELINNFVAAEGKL